MEDIRYPKQLLDCKCIGGGGGRRRKEEEEDMDDHEKPFIRPKEVT